MKIVMGLALVAATLIVAPRPMHAAAQAVAVRPSDQTLNDRIVKRISGTSLRKYNLSVGVDDAVATLTGSVSTEAERRRAGQLATMPGVVRVNNQLVVDLAADRPAKGTMGTIEPKTKDGLSKTGEVITDGWITTRVHSKFIDENLLKGSDITVDTKDHVVVLKGTVLSSAARARAVEQAKEVEGVHRVVDRLTIGPKP